MHSSQIEYVKFEVTFRGNKGDCVEDIVASFSVAELDVSIVFVVFEGHDYSLSLVNIMSRIGKVIVKVHSHVDGESTSQLFSAADIGSILSKDH